jgi:hypothetical protein
LAVAHASTLLSLLAKAHGSSVRAREALDRALTRSGLDELPSSPGDLSTFVRIDLRAVVEADFGAMIADEVTDQLCLQLRALERTPSPRSRPAAPAPSRALTPREGPASRHQLGTVTKTSGVRGRSPEISRETRTAGLRSPVDEEVTADLSEDPRRED